MPNPAPAPSKLKTWSARENDLLTLVLVAVLVLALGAFAIYAELTTTARTFRVIVIGLSILASLAGVAFLWMRIKTQRARRGPAHQTLLWLGIVSLFAVIVANALIATAPRGSLWPLFLAGAGCVYLWWLSSLIFDLVFVWHRYIQGDVAMNFLRKDVRAQSTDHGPDPASSGMTAPRPPRAPTPGPFQIKLRKEPKPQLATE